MSDIIPRLFAPPANGCEPRDFECHQKSSEPPGEILNLFGIPEAVKYQAAADAPEIEVIMFPVAMVSVFADC